MDIVTRKQINILIQLAEADKHFASEERDLIFKIAKARNFPQEEVRQLIRNPEPIGTLGALSENQRFDYLLTCVNLVVADKKIFDSELLFCKDIAIKLGFKKDVVDYMIQHMHVQPIEKVKEAVLSSYG